MSNTSNNQRWDKNLCRGETIRSALDTLAVCSVTPKTQLAFCESVQIIGEDEQQAVTPSIRSVIALVFCLSFPTFQVNGLRDVFRLHRINLNMVLIRQSTQWRVHWFYGYW